MKDNKKKKVIILIIIFTIILFLGATYAIVIDYLSKTGKNSSLVVGDIYMHYNEGNKQISLSNAMPSNTYSNDYFEFTIDGKNTSNKNINYLISLSYGDIPSNRTTRIKDNLLDFKLVEVVNNQENVLVDTINFNSLNNANLYTTTIPSNTNNYLKTYRLYMKISYNTVIGNVGQDYTIDEWNNIFASIKVNVSGDFADKMLAHQVKNSSDFKKYVKLSQDDTCKIYIEEDGITYVSGTKDCIDFNYVWYSGKLWRITSINPDGTMKLITDDPITTISYNADNDVNFYDISKKDDATYTGSYMYQWLNEDFLDTLYNYQNIIVEDSTWNITTCGSISAKLASTTLINNSTIDKTTPVGLLNSYEYYLSYKNTSYESGYLNIGYEWWLLNSRGASDMWGVHNDGNYGHYYSPIGIISVRPSINLKSNIQLSGGSGTKNNPFTISGDKEQPTINTTLLNTRTRGEYVVFDEDGNASTKEIYRIVGIEDEKVKLNKNDYIRSSGEIVAKQTNSRYGSGKDNIDWDYYLNNTWYNSLASIDMLDKGTYYIKRMPSGSYKNSLCNTNNTTETINDCVKTTSIWNGYVGLPRLGEMFASQQGEDYNSSNNMWLITPKNNNEVYNIISSGYGSTFSISLSRGYCARPSIYLKSNVVITGGSGTPNDPFTIALKN